jgi:negative regulator of flagellin synthesis FlgM
MTGISDLQTVFGSVGSSQQTTQTGAAKGNAGEAAAKTYDGAAANDGQRVSVSSTAGALAQVSGESDVRQDKVAQLQAAISNGTYNVSSSDVADKLIASMQGGR